MCIHPLNFRGCIGRPFYVLTNPVYANTLSRLSAHSLALRKLKYPHFETMWAPDKLHSAAPCVERKKKIKMMIG